MERLIRCLSIAVLAAALVSCDVFFAPLEDRFNIKDPDNELSTFKPTIDGYVEGSTWYDKVNYLYVWPDSKMTLMRFDTGDFPESVAASYLKLQVYTPPTNDVDLSIHRIISDWDPALISYSVADDPVRFYDGSAVVKLTIPATVKTGDVIQIPVTEVYSGGKDKLSNGLVILIPPLTSQELQFNSTESGTGPLLSIEPG